MSQLTYTQTYVGGTMPTATAVIRSQPADFYVEEINPVELSGEGEHLWLWVEKENLNTQKVQSWLAKALSVRPHNIGYSGLKDRHAVTRQWFSLPWPIKQDADALVAKLQQRERPFEQVRIDILAAKRHGQKLRVGTHRQNRFKLVLRDVVGDKTAMEDALLRLQTQGIPNYFGPQRFGHDQHNLELAQSLFGGKKLRKRYRDFALSAARAWLFNQVLAARIEQRTWQTVLAGDVLMLDGSHSIFNSEFEDLAALQHRANQFDIHPTGPLVGQGWQEQTSAQAAAIEQDILTTPDNQLFTQGLAEHNGLNAARRPLRAPVQELAWQWLDDATLELNFVLPTGSYATSLLREVVLFSQPN